jgi:hypothetical protein
MLPLSSNTLTAVTVRVLCLTLLLSFIITSNTQSLFAQQSAGSRFDMPSILSDPLPTQQQADEYPVILQKLELQREETTKLLSDTVLAEREKMVTQFKESVLELHEHLIFLREKPDDPVRQANYEEALSKALTRASEHLADFQNLQPQVLKAVNGLRETIVSAQEECRRSQQKSEQQLAERSQSVKAIEDRLKTLAAQYSAQLSGNTPLPPDVALNVRLLEADLRNAQHGCRLAELMSSDMQQRIAELGSDNQRLLQLRDDLTVSFRKAGGQRWLLAEVAEIKRSRTSQRKFKSQINAILQQLPRLNPNIDMDDMIKVLEGSGLPNHPVTPPSAPDAAPSTSEHEILKHYLPSHSATTTPDQTVNQ